LKRDIIVLRNVWKRKKKCSGIVFGLNRYIPFALNPAVTISTDAAFAQARPKDSRPNSDDFLSLRDYIKCRDPFLK
jgi:hypothetical protein